MKKNRITEMLNGVVGQIDLLGDACEKVDLLESEIENLKKSNARLEDQVQHWKLQCEEAGVRIIDKSPPTPNSRS